ncbi:MAG TPA: ATP-grasp domain-containing protein [Pilimelia sp.]|nr:ATP-grasp domain-containing protein [Pilimelia sp.]
MSEGAGATGRDGGGPGALVIGGDYRALGVVRSLGRRGIRVWVVRSAGDHGLAGMSRFSRRRLIWPDDGDESRLAFLLDLCDRERLDGWTLFPTADATAAFVARRHAELAARFRLTTPAWDSFVWAYDKRLTYELAVSLDVPHPRVFTPRDRAEVAGYTGGFPVVLKPATKPRLNLPRAKAWLVRDAAELPARYDEVAPLAEPGALMLQELIPGAGGQLSFAALCQAGEPLVTTVAERVRQYPVDFGRSSSYVETIDDAEVDQLARRVLRRLRFDGLVEIEFKRDPRDGLRKLLDINVRVWGWHTIGSEIGLDFTYLAWRLANGQPVSPVRVPPGLRWLRLTTDLPAAYEEIRRGQLSLRGYLHTLLSRHERPVAALDDPLPGVLEVPMFVMGRPGILGR